MCKEMMGQRNKIEAMVNEELQRCLENIRQSGGYKLPAVRVDLEKLFIANREYFEHQGFFFDPETRVENNQIRYYAWMKLGGEGELARKCWKKIREAREAFVKEQRKKITEALRAAEVKRICVNLNNMLFENKLFFEESGYVFVHATAMNNEEKQYMAWMEKRL